MVDETKSSADDERDVDFSQLDSGTPANANSDEVAAAESNLELSEAMTKLKAERDDFQDKYLRALADADNIRKRAMKERSELIKYQGEQIFTDLLTVIDDFDLALSNSGTELESFRQGIEMIHKRFLEVLGKWDVRGESAIGKPFEPSKHEALSKVPNPDAQPGTVINELKKTFFYKDKLIRPGQVIVAGEPTE